MSEPSCDKRGHIMSPTSPRCGVCGVYSSQMMLVTREVYEQTRQRLAAAEARNVTLQKGIDAVQSLINESHGVAGLHLNGDVATWSSLLAGGEYEEWLREFSEAAKGGRE